MPSPDRRRRPPFELRMPAGPAGPLVCSSPHSGRHYPAAFRRLSRLDARSLRRSEDCHVDGLFAGAPEAGAPLLAARFARAYLDLNRAADELDPLLFAEPLPPEARRDSDRVAAGLGVVARVVASGMPIYSAPLPLAEAERRIARIHVPYHRTLARLLGAAHRRWGWALLVDCHSMPSRGNGAFDGGDQPSDADIVLGDCHGRSCAPLVMDAATAALREMGYRVVRNVPYAGGYCTSHYGRPAQGIHALQVEINRALYMDEVTFARAPAFAAIAADMACFVRRLQALDLRRDRALAAE
ncbi:MAG: N-formylglutamate amidohydrolase [Alphaproteobacteria bacterium]|nr:MAG: N-formylglutamate amidohydrolase [Alphaproteobacteria bacterium]